MTQKTGVIMQKNKLFYFSTFLELEIKFDRICCIFLIFRIILYFPNNLATLAYF